MILEDEMFIEFFITQAIQGDLCLHEHTLFSSTFVAVWHADHQVHNKKLERKNFISRFDTAQLLHKQGI